MSFLRFSVVMLALAALAGLGGLPVLASAFSMLGLLFLDLILIAGLCWVFLFRWIE